MSIIFLIVALLLVIGGFITAGVAKQLADSEGIDLSIVSKQSGVPVISEREYKSEKISVTVSDAKINIIGGADRACVEMVNFTEGMYELSESNNVLVIKEGVDFKSVQGIASTAMNFKGLRSFINYYNMKDLERTVNIYVSDEKTLNNIAVFVESGDVSVTGIDAKIDLEVHIGTGSLEMNNVTTSSSVTVEIGTGDASIAAKFGKLDADITTGNLDLDYLSSLRFVSVKLFTGDGAVSVNGEACKAQAQLGTFGAERTIDINIGSGNITINTDEEAVEEIPEDPEADIEDEGVADEENGSEE